MYPTATLLKTALVILLMFIILIIFIKESIRFDKQQKINETDLSKLIKIN